MRSENKRVPVNDLQWKEPWNDKVIFFRSALSGEIMMIRMWYNECYQDDGRVCLAMAMGWCCLCTWEGDLQQDAGAGQEALPSAKCKIMRKGSGMWWKHSSWIFQCCLSKGNSCVRAEAFQADPLLCCSVPATKSLEYWFWGSGVVIKFVLLSRTTPCL